MTLTYTIFSPFLKPRGIRSYKIVYSATFTMSLLSLTH